MTQECRGAALLRHEVKHTMSCSSPTKTRWARNVADRQPKHCGYCVPCLIRRAAIIGSWGSDDTEYQVPDLHAQVLNTRRAEGEHVRSFQLALARLAQRPGRARFDIHRPGPLTDHVDRLADYEGVYVRGLQEVGRLLQGVRAEPL